MDLPSNIIKHFLRNVYFVSGCACGGKSTISKYLSEKYKVVLYNWDERFPQHKEISDPSYQPYMNKEFRSWEEYFSRPPLEYAESIRKSMLEQVEIAIIELIKFGHTLNFVPHVSAPILMVNATGDGRELGEELYRAMPEPRKQIWYESNHYLAPREYNEDILAWLHKYLD